MLKIELITDGEDRFVLERRIKINEPLEKTASRIFHATFKVPSLDLVDGPEIEELLELFDEVYQGKGDRLNLLNVAIRNIDEEGGGALDKHQIFNKLHSLAGTSGFPIESVDKANDFFWTKDGRPTMTNAKAMKARISRYLKKRDEDSRSSTSR